MYEVCIEDVLAGKQVILKGNLGGFNWNLLFEIFYRTNWQKSGGDLTVTSNKGPLDGNVDGKYKNFYTQFLSADLVWVF